MLDSQSALWIWLSSCCQLHPGHCPERLRDCSCCWCGKHEPSTFCGMFCLHSFLFFCNVLFLGQLGERSSVWSQIFSSTRGKTQFAVSVMKSNCIFCKMECALWSALTDWHARIPMAITAENLATKYNISREDCDNFALLSQKRWADAQKGGKFKNEITPVTVKVKGKEVVFEVDEHPKPDTTMEILARLPTGMQVLKSNYI